jgi:hypothetical protein
MTIFYSLQPIYHVWVGLGSRTLVRLVDEIGPWGHIESPWTPLEREVLGRRATDGFGALSGRGGRLHGEEKGTTFSLGVMFIKSISRLVCKRST